MRAHDNITFYLIFFPSETFNHGTFTVVYPSLIMFVHHYACQINGQSLNK